MKSRWITNLLLLIAIASLSLVVHFEPGIEQQPENPAITSLTVNDVQRVHINRPVREDMVLLRTGTQDWSIERTPPLPADNFQVNALLKLVQQKPVRSYPAADLELAQLQLDPPNATAIFNDIAIEFGSLEPLQGLRYIRVGDQVHLIPDLYLHLVEAGYTQFVRRRLLDAGAHITAIKLPELTLQQATGNWSIEPEQEISADALQRFIDDWQQAAALNVQAADTTVDGETIEITFAGEPGSLSLVIVSREPELVLARPDLGIQYRMGSTANRLLELAPAPAEDTQTPP